MERLRKHFRGKRALSADQYGFRAGCSTIDVARRLKKLAASAIKERQFGAAVSLNIHNAFNSMPWMRILEALVNAKVPVYLCNIIRGGICANGIGHGLKRDDMRSTARVSARTAIAEYRLR